MPVRQGRYTLALPSQPAITGWAAIGGKKRGRGLLAKNSTIFMKTRQPARILGKKPKAPCTKTPSKSARVLRYEAGDVDMIFSGDLLNQCIGTTFGIRELGIPLAGLYGACLDDGAVFGYGGDYDRRRRGRHSGRGHGVPFLLGGKQFRMPLNTAGGVRRHAMGRHGGGAAVIGQKGEGPRVSAVIIGRIQDLGIKDANNMGAAMAPSACSTIADFLRDTNTRPQDYDLILTGDLGSVGSALLIELANTGGYRYFVRSSRLRSDALRC